MPDVKNIGKPCAGEPHARFDEGGQAKACSLLHHYLELLRQPGLFQHRIRRVTRFDLAIDNKNALG